MTEVAQRTTTRVHWSALLGALAVVLGVVLVAQPVIESTLTILLSLGVIWLLSRVRRRTTEPWRTVSSALAGATLALLGYLVLWFFAVPTGFPSPYFGSPAAELTSVYGDPGSTRLEVGVDTCNQEPNVTAEETADEVRLSSNAKVPRGGRDDCADRDVVTLEQPLGQRRVIDEATDEELPVRQHEP